MYLDKNKIIESLTEDDITKVVMDLGSDKPRTGNKQGELIFQTICHNVSGGSYKLYYYHNATDKYPAKTFHCYSGCGDSFNIIELIIRSNRAKQKKITFFQALNYLAKLTGYKYEKDLLQPQVHLIDDWSFINKFRKSGTSPCIPILPAISEHYLDLFYYAPHEEFLKDHIAREVLEEFEIGYWGKTNQITIPHRDYKQNLVGIRGRFISEEDVRNIGKYAPLLVEDKFLNHPLGSNLYGIHINQFKIMQCKKVLLVESEKGVLQNHSYFGQDDFSLATCGQNITQEQISLLLNYLGVEEVILGYDKMFVENGSLKEIVYRNKLYKKIIPLLPYCKVSLLWDKYGLLDYKQAPTDYGKEVLMKLLDKKIEITMTDIEEMREEEKDGYKKYI